VILYDSRITVYNEIHDLASFVYVLLI